MVGIRHVYSDFIQLHRKLLHKQTQVVNGSNGKPPGNERFRGSIIYKYTIFALATFDYWRVVVGLTALFY